MNHDQLRPDSATLHQQALAHRSRLMGLMLARLVRAIVRIPATAKLTVRKRHAILGAQGHT